MIGVATSCPSCCCYSRGRSATRIALELPDTLDQMTIAVEAGLGFESAMAQAGQNGNGPLAEELVRTLQDIQVGQTRREAYEALAERTGVPDLRRFIRAVIQADDYGISIADVLRTQAREMRLKRRQRAEEKAMQIPVKVIFPLMLCILPVLFIVLLGPAAMDIIDYIQGNVNMSTTVIILTALVAGGWQRSGLTGWMRQVAKVKSVWLASYLHVVLATGLGLERRRWPSNWAELVGYTVLGVGCALLVVRRPGGDAAAQCDRRAAVPGAAQGARRCDAAERGPDAAAQGARLRRGDDGAVSAAGRDPAAGSSGWAM